MKAFERCCHTRGVTRRQRSCAAQYEVHVLRRVRTVELPCELLQPCRRPVPDCAMRSRAAAHRMRDSPPFRPAANDEASSVSVSPWSAASALALNRVGPPSRRYTGAEQALAVISSIAELIAGSSAVPVLVTAYAVADRPSSADRAFSTSAAFTRLLSPQSGQPRFRSQSQHCVCAAGCRFTHCPDPKFGYFVIVLRGRSCRLQGDSPG